MRRAIVHLAATLLLASCASQTNTTTPSASTLSPADQMVALDTGLNQAREKNVDILAPTSFGKAEELLTEGKKIQTASGGEEAILAKVTAGNQYLAKANEFATKSQTLLNDLINTRAAAHQAFKDAKKVGATGLEDLTNDFKDADDHFLKLTMAVETENSKWAESHKADVATTYQTLETRAVKKWSLDTSRRAIDTAIEEGAKKYAPKSLLLAETTYADAEKFISGNTRNREEIQKKGASTLFISNRLLHLTKEGKIFAEKKPEEITLWVENRIQGIGQLVTPDTRDQHFDDQVKTIQSSIEELKQNRRGLAEETQKLRSDVQSLNSVVQKTQPQVELDAKYKEVRTQFDSTEAEVLRDAGKIVVRLKAIKFPVGKAILLPENYPLLAKVQKAIRLFGQPNLVIEGHTDSVGSAPVNERLSLDRANAVKEYLVANNTISTEKVITAGFGFNRPLVSDRTSEGRAINRRIDVIIEP